MGRVLLFDCQANYPGGNPLIERCAYAVCDLPQNIIDMYLEGQSQCTGQSNDDEFSLCSWIRLQGTPAVGSQGTTACWRLFVFPVPPYGDECDECPPPTCPSCCPDMDDPSVRVIFDGWAGWSLCSQHEGFEDEPLLAKCVLGDGMTP